MRKTTIALVGLCLLSALPVQAGNLVFDSGQTVWRPNQCSKPTPPSSVLTAHPETAGNDMNTMMGMHNSYVDAMQEYMNCISSEAERDQNVVIQSITNSARKVIADAQAEVDSAAPPRSRQQ